MLSAFKFCRRCSILSRIFLYAATGLLVPLFGISFVEYISLPIAEQSGGGNGKFTPLFLFLGGIASHMYSVEAAPWPDADDPFLIGLIVIGNTSNPRTILCVLFEII